MKSFFQIRRRWLVLAWLSAGCVAILASPVLTSGAECSGPVAVVASCDGDTLFVAHADARRIAAVRTADGKVVHAIEMPSEPTAMALHPDGKRLYVTCAAPKSTVCVVDVTSCEVVDAIPAGHTATGLTLTHEGKRLYVCNRFNNDMSVIDLESGKEVARVPVTREPVGAVATPDGKSVFVINHLPLDRADSGGTAAVVTVIDTAAAELGKRPNEEAVAATMTIRLPNGSSSVRGVCISPDGKQVYVTHILSRYQMPTTQLDRGWMNTNVLSIIDVQTKKLLNTVLLDDVDLGAANPWGVALTADGRQICVAHAGTHELSVIDAIGLLDRLEELATVSNKQPPSSVGSDSAYASVTADDVPNDLSLLVDLRKRIPLEGVGPRGFAIVDSTAYVAEYYTDTLATVDLSTGAVGQIALGPKPEPSIAHRGQMLFQNAKLCFQHWQSCDSCHPDARVDGLNWDLLNDGMGNPKNSRSMLFAHQSSPVMSLGVRKNAEQAVRAGIRHILFAVRPEEEAEAIDEYLKSLQPVPSPHLVDGQLSPAAERGKQIFFDAAVGCAQCHQAPMYADKSVHDVGSAGEFDQPTDKFSTSMLVEVWRTAPYMHDGRYLTIKELIVHGKHGNKDNNLNKLTEPQVNDLVEFVLSL